MLSTSVVIPAWNGLPYLQKNLPKVKLIGSNEIILVDDASTDGTYEYVHEHFPEIKVIRHSSNLRFPISANDGIAAASGEVIILLNQDVTPESNLLASVIPHFQNEKIFAVTFNEKSRSWARAKLDSGFIEFTNGKLDEHQHLSFWASGGSAAFRKKMWVSLGGFDPVFTPGYYEDLDLGYRSYKRGLKIIWEPKAKVEHVAETVFKKAFSDKQLVQIKERNFLIAHWKNLDSVNLLQHFVGVTKRIFSAPGFIVPFVWATAYLPHVLSFRIGEKKLIKISDSELFQMLNHDS
jgi:GT2 family glycosyltransferase